MYGLLVGCLRTNRRPVVSIYKGKGDKSIHEFRRVVIERVVA